jgi:flavoprotein
MKTISKSLLITAVLLGFTSLSEAGAGKNWPVDFNLPVKSKEEAVKLPAKSKIALVCKDCKTVVANCSVDEKPKSFLSWFKEDQTHGCDGCKGTIKYVGSLKNPVPTHSHECSKCGAGSAYSCADHAPNAK